jgi:hypothetical protein
MHDEGNEQEYKEDKEDDLRDARGGTREATKSKCGRDERDDQKREGPTKHSEHSFCV